MLPVTSRRSRRDERPALGIHCRGIRRHRRRDRRYDAENCTRLPRVEAGAEQNGGRKCHPRRCPMSTTTEVPRRPARWLLFLPIVAFVALAALFFLRLYAGDASLLPSAL